MKRLDGITDLAISPHPIYILGAGGVANGCCRPSSLLFMLNTVAPHFEYSLNSGLVFESRRCTADEEPLVNGAVDPLRWEVLVRWQRW